MLRRKGYFEHGQVEPSVGVEIGAVTPDILTDLSPAPELSPSEQNIMFENMDQSARLLRFVFCSHVHGDHAVYQRKSVFLVQEDSQSVLQLIFLGWRMFLGSAERREK
jgi:hypothetical protein